MHCENGFCVYESNNKCTLDEISIDSLGMCASYMHADISEHLLSYLKDKDLNQSDMRDRMHTTNKEIYEQLETDAILILLDEEYPITDKYSVDKELWEYAIKKAFENLSAEIQYELIFSREEVKKYLKKSFPIDSIISKYINEE